ncbi:hypothetical protein PVAP13_5NG178743 [Panicum virgatum]|uniref:Cytochrome b/b6 C-terminal region profile domain-containing protein n=1 Tax=Panicum virgatum TaxID=38727 RepID=A0A8T0RNI7_PANVG|nr:hypothetical protein PVAP13_5NG178743 [Panicum virgatum]
MSGSFGGWILKNSPIPITKKPDLNDLVLRAKLAKGMGHNYYGEPAWPNDLLYIFSVVILGTIACNVGLAVLELSMIGEPADPFATPLQILPESYFFPVFQILRTVPNKLLGILLMVSVPTGLLTVPFLELNILPPSNLRFYLPRTGDFTTWNLRFYHLPRTQDFTSLKSAILPALDMGFYLTRT